MTWLRTIIHLTRMHQIRMRPTRIQATKMHPTQLQRIRTPIVLILTAPIQEHPALTVLTIATITRRVLSGAWKEAGKIQTIESVERETAAWEKCLMRRFFVLKI